MPMTNLIKLACGCTARIDTASRTRVIETREERCTERHHVPGGRVWLWELLVDPRHLSGFDSGDGWRTKQSLL